MDIVLRLLFFNFEATSLSPKITLSPSIPTPPYISVLLLNTACIMLVFPSVISTSLMKDI